MIRNVLFVFLRYFCLCTVVCFSTTLQPLENNVINLSLFSYNKFDADVPQVFSKRVQLKSDVSYILNITDISESIDFIVAQVHSYYYNLTFSYDHDDLDLHKNQSITGTNVGLYFPTNGKQSIVSIIRNTEKRNISAMVAAVTYSKKSPIPGGCNMEFNVEVSPFQKVHLTNITVIVEAQPGSAPKITSNNITCQTESIHHDMYMTYIAEQDYSPEGYFDIIEKLLTPDDVKKNSVKMPLSTFGSTMRRVYSAYPGTGSAYAIVAVYGNYSSAYVPTFTYACNPLNGTDTCDVLRDKTSKVMCALVLLIGITVTFFGRHLFKMEMFLVSTFAGGIIAYTICFNIGLSSSDAGTAAMITGVILAVFWWVLWLCCGLPFLLSGLCSLSFGFLCACLMYNYLPDGTYFAQVEYYFWPIFIITMLLIALPLIPLYFFTNRLCCAVLGAFAIVIPIDYYIGSNLKYILINYLRRATHSGFNAAILHPPMQYRDIILIVLWIFLSFLSLFKQALLITKIPYLHI